MERVEVEAIASMAAKLYKNNKRVAAIKHIKTLFKCSYTTAATFTESAKENAF